MAEEWQGWEHERKEMKINLVPYRACYCESKHHNSSIVQCPCIFPGSRWLDVYVVTIINSQFGEHNAKFLLGPSRTTGKVLKTSGPGSNVEFILHKTFSLQRFLRFLPLYFSYLSSLSLRPLSVRFHSFIHLPGFLGSAETMNWG